MRCGFSLLLFLLVLLNKTSSFLVFYPDFTSVDGQHRLHVCILRELHHWYSVMGDTFPHQGEPGICGHRRLPVKCHTRLSSASLWIQMTACLPSVDQVAPCSKGPGRLLCIQVNMRRQKERRELSRSKNITVSVINSHLFSFLFARVDSEIQTGCCMFFYLWPSGWNKHLFSL